MLGLHSMKAAEKKRIAGVQKIVRQKLVLKDIQKYGVWGFVFSEDNWYLFVTQVTVWVEICLQDFSEGLLKSE